TSGPATGGTSVSISGTNFVANATVRFGNASATNVNVVSASTITATTPGGAVGTVSVTVTNPGGQSSTLPSAFTYLAAPAPTISGISPSTGTGGTSVTISGANFAANAAVR